MRKLEQRKPQSHHFKLKPHENVSKNESCITKSYQDRSVGFLTIIMKIVMLIRRGNIKSSIEILAFPLIEACMKKKSETTKQW